MKEPATAEINHQLPQVVQTSSPFEFRFSLTDVRVQSFFRIFGLKQLLLQFALERQRRLKRYLSACLDCAFNAADGPRSFVGSSELACIVDRLSHEIRAVFCVDDSIHEIKLFALFKIK